MTANQGSQARLGVGATSPATQFMEYLTHNIKKRTIIVNDEGIRGTRDRYVNRSRKTQERVGGTINMCPSPTEIDWWIQRILGGTTATGVTAVAETLPDFYMIWDSGDTVHEWNGCKAGRATISGNPGQPINWAVDIEAKTETKDAASFPAITPATDSMFVFSDIILTLGGTARKSESFSLVIDNVLDAERFLNSLTRDEIPATDRIITLTCQLPWNGDNDDLYDMAMAGVEGSLALSDGTDTYTFDFGKLLAPAEGPDGPARAELKMPLVMRAYNDGTNASIKCTKS